MQRRFLVFALAIAPACFGRIGDPSPTATGSGASEGGAMGGTLGGTSVPPGGSSGSSDPFTPPGSTGSGGSPASFACAAGAPLSGEPLRRLTSTQFGNTISDLLTYALPGNADQVRAVLTSSAVAQAFLQLPSDERKRVPQDLHGSFRRLDQDLDQVHVEGFFAIAHAIGAALAEPGRIGMLLGACATDADAGNDKDCLTSFVQRFGALALRRPLTDDDVAFYLGYNAPSTGIDPAGLADIVAGLLVSPDFLYIDEHGAAANAADPGRVALSSFELATRLAYHFWQTMPDPALMEAARSNALQTDAGYRAAVDRLFADPRTQATMDQFFSEGFKLEDLPALGSNADDPAYRTFAGADMPGPGLRQAMFDEVVDLFRYYTWRQPAGFNEVLQSDLVLTKDPALARIYGKKVWIDGAAPDRFAAGERPGLLTRAAFLVNGSSNTRPIMKGVFLRRTLLCDDIPPPPENANAVPPPGDPNRSTRQIVEGITESPGTVCAGCHKAIINPLGFATENYDALGRIRTEQRLFDASGAEIGKVPVDTRSVPQVVLGDLKAAQGPSDLVNMVVSSGKAHACLARQYFRFSFGRWEDMAVDGCTLESLRRALVAGNSLQAMFKEVALLPQFRQRSFQ
jgi:hypothetical protein